MGKKGTIIIDTKKAWFYPEGHKNNVLGEVDGVSGTTIKRDDEKGFEINIEHLDPSKQALLDFKTAIFNNKQPDSGIITGAKAAICVQMGLDAMYKSKFIYWNPNLIPF